MSKITIMLADDDADDCIFFKEALEDLKLTATLTIANDGIELMHILKTKRDPLPDLLFLDLNMPRKTGYECLSEIKTNPTLNQLPVIIFSTSFDTDTVNLLHEKGAHYYLRKPGEFSKLKELICKAVRLSLNTEKIQPARESFVING